MAAQRLDMLVDLVDSTDRVIGTARRRQVFQQPAGFRVAHVFVFNGVGELLLQQIAPGLRHPGQWGSSVAGYVQAGESYDAAATRKVHDELGVSPPLAEHGKTSMVDQGLTKFIELFTASFDGPFFPNQGDVSLLEFVSLPQIQVERASGTRAFTETFLHLLDFYLRSSSMGP
ncbi:MAG TPA: NUDIX domain-containing protein [Polyangiaceae bacterium]|nr:NUDIX domain-containing protein [Polyangiaceae bacterium]